MDGETGEDGNDSVPAPVAAPDDAGPCDGADADDDQADADAAWSPEYDRTRETLRWLRDKRRAHRGQRNRDLAVTAYGLLLLGVGYGSTLGYRFAQRLGHLAADDHTSEATGRALSAVLVLLACGLAVLAARDALWRGPVLVPRPDLSWPLAQPVRRDRLLRPAFRLTTALMTVGGVLCAVGGAVLLRLTGTTALGPALALCMPAGVCLPLLAAALALQVERRLSWARRVRTLTPYAVLLLIALAGQAAWAAASGGPAGGQRAVLRVLETAELWSGPWGWAVQPILHASSGHVPGWSMATALLAVVTAAAVVHADRTAGTIPTRRLRARAATAATVASVLWSVEPRAAKLAVAEALADGASGTRRRLPAPRSRRLVVAWRDAVALLRGPGRLVGAALWIAAGAGAASVAVALEGAARLVVLAVALALGWFGVGRLAETARLEADDLRRSSWSPFRFRGLMFQHALVPAALGAVLTTLAAVPFALYGGERALLLMPLCAPPFAAAAVLAAVRGPVRTELMSLGLVTPAGDASAFVFLFWYAAPFLTTVTVLTAGLGTSGVLDPGAPAEAFLRPVMTALTLTSGLLFATARRVKKLLRPAV
ncbi:hypothetical protein MMF93_28200 [Streptomyces tubbatahanensis]|uniref:ABC-2 type transport system permease protein n=1 Tax=Streptomyces tubbatahanensis TaxID=2923272 RepID=A0ABY3XZI5_9ACTN|nr:hypothetical protein [Streptomyces tubbatahanensis]UNS99907.1 hypothetical protein MMF93_28200 [Streptomyces tubbatahanensis]